LGNKIRIAKKINISINALYRTGSIKMRNIAHHGDYNSVKLSSHQECIRQKSNAFSTYPDQHKQFFLRKRQLGDKKEKR